MRELNKTLAAYICLAMFFLAGCASPSNDRLEIELAGKIVRSKGPSRCMSRDGKTLKALKVGDIVNAGELIQTAMEKGCFVDILWTAPISASMPPNPAPTPPNGWDKRLWLTPDPALQVHDNTSEPRFNLRLREDSVLKVEQLAEVKSSSVSKGALNLRLDLRKGRATIRLTGVPQGMDCQVRFTNCVAKILSGTVEIRDECLIAIRGKASVTRATGQVIAVPPGFAFKAQTGVVEPMPLID